MSKKPQRPRHANQRAKRIVDAGADRTMFPETSDKVKLPDVSAARKLAAMKGGEARARKLSPERRKEIAKKAAAASREKARRRDTNPLERLLRLRKREIIRALARAKAVNATDARDRERLRATILDLEARLSEIEYTISRLL